MSLRILHSVTLFAALCVACSSAPPDPQPTASTAETPRKPLGKADAAGSCQGAGQDFCGGKSADACCR